jgi:hypothetical protein
MIVSAPAWLWQLVLPLLLLLLFLLQRRGRVHVVSSHLLWRGFSDSPHRRRFALPPLDLALLLGLLILTGLALSAAGPWLTRGPASSALAVILDCSSSMATADGPGGERRIDTAGREALSLLRAADGRPTRLLVLAGAGGSVVSAGPGETGLFEEALEGPLLVDGEPPLDTLADSAAAVIRAAGGGRVVVISDFAGTPPLAPDAWEGVRTDFVAVGDTAPNVAVTALVVSPLPARDGTLRATATIAGNAPLPERLWVEAEVEGGHRDEATLEPGRDGSIEWSFEFETRPGATLAVSVRPGGALADDDTLRVALPASTSFALGADVELPRAIAAALDVLGEPGRRFEPQDEVTIYRGDPPSESAARWIALPAVTRRAGGASITPGGLDIFGPDGAFLEPFHPILVEPGLVPASAPPAGARPIAAVGGRPAIALVEDELSRGIWCGIPLEATDLAGRGALPLVMAAMVAWLDGDASGAPRAQRATSPDLTPRPPEGARRASDRHSKGPSPLRGALLGFVAVLVLLEATRRALSFRLPAKVGGAS